MYLLNNKIKALFLGFLFSVTYSILGLSSECESISEKILRLHIIANSDSKEDQELKLKIRDKILLEYSEQLSVKNDIEEAKNEIIRNIDKIRLTAQNEVYKNGFDYKINAEITNMYFNPRRYNDITLPSGFYNALRITIGEGKGKNWWCVMFPPICLAVTEEKSDLQDILTPSEMDLVENNSQYSFKLKIVDIIIQIGNFLSLICEKLSDYSDTVFEEINQTYDIGFKTQEVFSSMNFLE